MIGILYLGKGPTDSAKFEYMHVDYVCWIIRNIGTFSTTLGRFVSIPMNPIKTRHFLLPSHNGATFYRSKVNSILAAVLPLFGYSTQQV